MNKMKCQFDLKNKNQIIKFEEVDPYNPQNTLKGYINRRQGQLYGSLWITHINGKRCPQLIYSAPKQHYPFDKDKNWRFPEFDSLQLYEKLDGTCIISYNYSDKQGTKYLTYKTRLRPFLGKGKYGNFFELWNEMRAKYQDIDKLCFLAGFNYVFELYGKRNKILIDYDVPLDTKLIFCIHSMLGYIYSPDVLFFPLEKTNYNIPILELSQTEYQIDEDKYMMIQDILEKRLIIDEENKTMKGKEGYVLYFIVDGMAKQIKCKPPSVLKYHWSGDAIPYESVLTTVYNAFENFDEPTYDDVVSLLKEEYDESKIEKSRVRITNILGKILFDKILSTKLEKDYRKQGFDINKDKVTCMRYFGTHYPKSEAKRIFNFLKQYEKK